MISDVGGERGSGLKQQDGEFSFIKNVRLHLDLY